MADISKITLPSGTTYDIKDSAARQDIDDLKNTLTGAMHYAGITTTPITDGSTTSTLVIEGESKVFTSDDAGATVIYGELEFVWNGSKWQEFGSTGSLKALAFKDSASGSFTPSGNCVNGDVILNYTTVNSMVSAGSLPELTTKVANENLTISFNKGTLPEKGTDTTVATGVKNVIQPTFNGTSGTVIVS